MKSDLGTLSRVLKYSARLVGQVGQSNETSLLASLSYRQIHFIATGGVLPD